MSCERTILVVMMFFAAMVLVPIPVVAFDYDRYDHYSPANCVTEVGITTPRVDEGVHCDIPTGKTQRLSQLTGVVVNTNGYSGPVGVCAEHLWSDNGPCVWIQDARSGAEVVFETRDLALIRSVSDWWEYVLVLKFPTGNPKNLPSQFIRGYKVFWK